MSQFPLNTGSPETFATVRSFLREIGFDAAGLCGRFGIKQMSSIGDVAWTDALRESLDPRLRLCLELLLRGQRVPADDLRAGLPPGVLDALSGLGLARPSRRSPGAFVCPVWVYPAEEFVIASDRRDAPDDPAVAPGNDIVFLAIYALTSRFLELLPDATGRDALDLCGGTGIGAMLLARRARSATTADIAERAANFATFNARLNAVPIESVCGDLFEPVGDRQFDVVIAHPPFVPEIGERVIFRDAGETGEEVTRRIIEGLPRHLRPGGRCLIVCWARDTEDGPFEQRVAGWLGPERDEFSVLCGVETSKSVEELVGEMGSLRKLSDDEQRRFYERLQALHTTRFVYGPVLVCRGDGGADGLAPGRVNIARSARWRDLEANLRWRRLRGAPDFAARLAQSRPRVTAGLEFLIRHTVRDGELKPESFTFTTDGPLCAEERVEGWMVPLIARLIGRETVAEVFQSLSQAGRLPPGFNRDACLRLVADAVEHGFLNVELD